MITGLLLHAGYTELPDEKSTAHMWHSQAKCCVRRLKNLDYDSGKVVVKLEKINLCFRGKIKSET